MRVLDLFSGIGGFSLGLERAGMTTVAFCEIDPYCRKVLAKHWPGVPIHDDIRLLDGGEYRGTVDLVCGGFPCQPFSVAGKRGGKGDDRHLWPEMLRIIREVQPRFVIGENVPGIIGMELDNCLSDLEALGYACGTFVIPACAVDARHRRDRVWIVGDSECSGLSGNNWRWTGQESADGCTDVAHSDVERQPQSQGGEFEVRGRPVNGGEVLADADGEGLEGWSGPRGSWSAHAVGGGSRSDGPRGAEWEPEPAIRRVAHGIPDRSHRLRALGNSVVPQVVEQIGRAIAEYR